MSKLDHEVALQSQALTGQRLRLQQQKQALRHGVMDYCKQPKTLACAALAGFVLARMGPLAYAVLHKRPADRNNNPIRGDLVSTLRVVLLSLAPTLLRQAIAAGLSSRDRQVR